MQRRAKLNIHCVDTYEEHLCVMRLLHFYLVFSVRQKASETRKATYFFLLVVAIAWFQKV